MLKLLRPRSRFTKELICEQCRLTEIEEFNDFWTLDLIIKSTKLTQTSMNSSLLMYLTAMSAVSIHNLVNNFNEVTGGVDLIDLETTSVNWTMNAKALNMMFPYCNGSLQSPIDIETKLVVENSNMRLGLTAYDKPMTGLLVNQFPTFQLLPISYKWPRPSAFISTSIARSYNPYAESHFTLSHIQFYWSQDDRSNLSLHRIDGQSYPVEINFLHINTAYSNLDEALSRSDGLLILSVLVVQSTHESYIFDKVLDDLSRLNKYGSKSMIDEDSTWRSLLPTDTSKFYRYQGSVPFPPCQQSVQWIVFADKLKLGQRQLKRFRRFRFSSRDLITGDLVNWSTQRRSLQNLNGRVVERSFNPFLNKERRRLSGSH